MLPDFLVTPRQLLQDREIQPLDCHVYGIIYWYTHMRLQTCTASNEHISDTLGVSKSGVNKAIVRLVKKRYVRSLYDRKHHIRTLIPLIAFRQENTPPETTDLNGTLAVSQTSPDEQAVSQTGKGSVPNGKKSQPQTASPNNKSKQEKEDIYHISSGTPVPNGPEKDIIISSPRRNIIKTPGNTGKPHDPGENGIATRETRHIPVMQGEANVDVMSEVTYKAHKQHSYGNEEVNAIIDAYTSRIGHIPADKKPRHVAQNIRQIIHTFIKCNTTTFQKLRGRPLSFVYVHRKCWEGYMEKDYAHQTEKLETFKLKTKVYLEDIATKLTKEAVAKNIEENSEHTPYHGEEAELYVYDQT